jgi:putative two-component system response regulator
MIPDHLRDSRVLVVDDEPANVELLDALLRRWGLADVQSTTDSSQVVEMCAVQEPDLVMLDLHMPAPDGFEVLSHLLPWTRAPIPLPVIMLTADQAPEVRRRALAYGAREFVSKPFDFEEVRLRTVNLLETRRAQRDLWRHHELLEGRIRERTAELELARRDVLQRLAGAAEYRDDDTGQHTRRVGRCAGLIARELGLASSTAEMLALAAPLHDVGKIGIPDAILLKPGRLTVAEFDVVKGHVEIGAKLLGHSASAVLETACRIAQTHHERWDGQGYSAGLTGDAIPLEGRVVAVADVFDALTHARPYKEAWSVQRALETVLKETGRAFDPDVVEAFSRLDHEALLAPVAGALPDDPASALRVPASPAPAVAARANGTGSTSSEGRVISLREAAQALSVSTATVRRWSDTGRIKAQRTAGGHRRFPIDEIRRVRAEEGFSTGTVRTVAPPSEQIVSLAEVLTAAGSQIHEQAATGLYEERASGWFRSEEAARLVANWARTLAAASLSGGYEPSQAATLALATSAEAGGTSLLERYTYLERFSAQTLRSLSDRPGVSRAELVSARRLLTSLRQIVLEEPAVPE